MWITAKSLPLRASVGKHWDLNATGLRPQFIPRDPIHAMHHLVPHATLWNKFSTSIINSWSSFNGQTGTKDQLSVYVTP